MKYGLSLKNIDRITNVFVSTKEIEEVVLYGSRAKGNHKPGSDIDLTLKGEKITTSILNTICSQLDDLLLPYTFDISIYDHLKNSDILEHIDRVGLRFYKR